MDTRNIEICQYDYVLPDHRIAKFPMMERDHSKLLIYNKGKIGEDHFFNLPEYLPEGSLMVFNNTKVIQARIHFRKDSGARIEIFLLEPYAPVDYEKMFQSRGNCRWLCLIGNLKKWKEGALSRTVIVNGNPVNVRATNKGPLGTSHIVELDWDNQAISLSELIDVIGELPIPPYLNRDAEESDKQTYQTVYSKTEGSVAAPTAGLHFTNAVLKAIDNRHILREEVTLHVGAGTFKPVKSATIAGHEMHTEHFSVHRNTIEQLILHQGKAIAVGTTSVRTLESLYYMGVKAMNNPDIQECELTVKQWEPYDLSLSAGNDVFCEPTVEALSALLRWMDAHQQSILNSSTQIIIAPGYKYKIVTMLITNFHQPRSTLLLLVSAFVNGDWKRIYDYALKHDFRFLSYGDSSLLIP